MDWSLLAVYGAMVSAGGMALLALRCLTAYRGDGRRWLLVWLGILVVTLVLLLPGAWVLARLGLAWRSKVLYTLDLILAGSGIGALVQTVRCYRDMLEQKRAGAFRKGVTLTLAGGACALIVAVMLLIGPVFAVFSAWDDRTVVWQGETVVEVNNSWLDPSFAYYPYYGPIIRGTNLLGNSSSPVV